MRSSLMLPRRVGCVPGGSSPGAAGPLHGEVLLNYSDVGKVEASPGTPIEETNRHV